MRLRRVPNWLEAGKENHLAFPELAEEILKQQVDMIKKIEGKMPLSPSTQGELQRQMYELFSKLVIYHSASGCNSTKCRIVAGVLIIYCWEGVTFSQSLSEPLAIIPTPFKPLCQPMGPMADVDVNQLKQSDAFSQVLDLAQAGAKWQETVTPDHPAIQEMARLRRKWSSSPEEVASDGFGAGVVRRVLQVDDARCLASSDGAVYVGKYGQIVRHGVDGQTVLNGFTYLDCMAVAGDVVVGIDRCFIHRARLSGIEASLMKHEVQGGNSKGLSLTDSHAYFCFGHAIACRDLQTWQTLPHPLIGKYHSKGCGDVSQPPTELLLKNPEDTAVVGSRLFVADTGNKRVLCWDMTKNQCQVVFEGAYPARLAAYHGGIFVYDQDQNKIFHVSMDTWDTQHVLGTGVRAYSPEGLPPLSTNLQVVESMTIGHDGELVFLYHGDPVVRGYWMPPLEAPMVLPVGPVFATDVPLLHQDPDEEQNAVVPSGGSQPTCGVEWQPFSKQPAAMYLSDTLPIDKDNFTLKSKMKRPTHGLGICLVAENPGQANRKPVDCHMLSPLEWHDMTHLTRLSKMREQKQLENQPTFQKLWRTAVDAFQKLVNNADTDEVQSFFLRGENYFEVEVQKSHNADADSLTWKLVKLKINGKDRAGALEPFTVGVDVAVRICFFAATEGGRLEFLEGPKLL